MGAFAADPPPAWDKPAPIPAETEFLRDRMDAPQNHFLLNGQEGFVSGREFYQAYGEANPFLWTVHPFLRYGTDRAWQGDSIPLAFRAQGSNEAGEGPDPYAFAEAAWEPLEGLRLHAGLDQNGLQARRTLPARRGFAAPGKEKEWAFIGGNLPPKSQANLGAAFERRGGTMAAQYNQGWWWTTSPVSGAAYPWEGFNADLVYRAGEDFDLTLVEQQWDSPSPYQFYKSHWRRSEITMSFLGASEGAWLWRLDVGFERRILSSEGAFRGFEEKTYPFRFRYRQDWEAPDSLPFRMLSQGSFGIRERLFAVQHSSEFRETVGTHQPMQFLRGYYRHPMQGYNAPLEQLTSDTDFVAGFHPGSQARGWVAGAEYREVRKRFLAGFGGDYAMEWELPLFQMGALDTLDGWVRRQGEFRGSEHLLQNASGKVFAAGDLGGLSGSATWRVNAGLRGFWGHDAPYVEYLPSPWWAGGAVAWTSPAKTRLDVQATYLGPKEVRGWGPVFEVPSHWENNLSVSQSLLSASGNSLKLTLAGLHAFGEDMREHPNGSPSRFRILAGVEGSFY